MKKIFILLAVLSIAPYALAQEVSADRFSDAVNHWNKGHEKQAYERYAPQQFREIADNIVAYQNEDGGWPKNLDMLAKLNPDSVRRTIDAKHLRSTLDNSNVYTQIEYLAQVYVATTDTVYRNSARRGMEYMLSSQYPNGGWRGWDADAITFNDNIMYGVLSTWLEVLDGTTCYLWVDDALKSRIRSSWEQGLALVLKTQYVQNGVKTVWAQQYDHTTLQPSQARSYELPGLAAGESADITMLLMRIKNPSPEVIDAVKAAVAWFKQTMIVGKTVKTISVPEGLAEDPKIKKDRVVVDDLEAKSMWARYYELEDNRAFFCKRTGEKVYSLAEVPAERRVGYAWYGTWGGKVLKKYPQWLQKIEAKTPKKK